MPQIPASKVGGPTKLQGMPKVMEELATQMANLAHRRAAEPGGERWDQSTLRTSTMKLRSGKATSARRRRRGAAAWPIGRSLPPSRSLWAGVSFARRRTEWRLASELELEVSNLL